MLSALNDMVVPVVRAGLHCGRREAPDVAHDRSVVPVVRAGLHCGRHGLLDSGPHPGSSPSSGRGSIAASNDPHPTGSGAVVVPVVRAGLHCGLLSDGWGVR